jgi:hypothetical protein
MKTYKYKSSSGDKDHTTTLHDDGRITCTCRGYRSPSKCWHVGDVAEKNNIPTHARSNTSPKPALLFDYQEEGVKELESSPSFGLREGDEITIGKSALMLEVEPMLASALKEGMTIASFTGPNWILEIKYDGHRMIIVVRHGNVTASARSGNARLLPKHLQEQLVFLPAGVYDGELYIPGHTHTDVVRLDLQDKLHLVLFDILYLEDPDTGDMLECMSRPHSYRRQLLEASMREVEDHTVLYIAPQHPVSAQHLQEIWDAGGEGVIVKDITLVYEPGRRHKRWVKFKKEQNTEVVVKGFLPGLLGPHSRIQAIDQHGKEVKSKVLNDHWRAVFATKADMFIDQPMIMTYTEKTRTGGYQHPRCDHFVNIDIESMKP